MLLGPEENEGRWPGNRPSCCGKRPRQPAASSSETTARSRFEAASAVGFGDVSRQETGLERFSHDIIGKLMALVVFGGHRTQLFGRTPGHFLEGLLPSDKVKSIMNIPFGASAVIFFLA